MWTIKRRSVPALVGLFIFAFLLGSSFLKQAQFELVGFTGNFPFPRQKSSLNFRRLFDGIPTAAPATSRFSVVIDNLAEGRPQAGVAAAGLVIEVPAEAGITRWLAFYELSCLPTGDLPKGDQVSVVSCPGLKIGPVRSLRPYFLDLAEGYKTPIAHVGGSPEALKVAKRSRLFTMNEFSFGRFFFRDPARKDPHRIFTTPSLLLSALEEIGVAFGDLTMPWTWKGSTKGKLERRKDEGTVNFSFTQYPLPPEAELSWAFNPTTSLFERKQGGVLQHDEDGVVITAKNLFVVETTILITDAIGRRRITTTGTGTAWRLTSNGKERLIWKRTAGGPFSFATTQGKSLELLPGKVWIVIVPAGQQVVESEKISK